MPYHDAMFHGFEGRLDALKTVERYIGHELMFYRTNLADHGPIVQWVTAELLPYARKAFPDYFNVEMERKVLTLALVHDDAEIITGDLPSCLKSIMGSSQRRLWKSKEEDAIDELVERFPETVNGFNYGELLFSAMRKDSIGAQLVSYADKIVGFGESMHELYAGNDFFTEDRKGKMAPAQRYIKEYFRERKEEWPLLGPLFNYRHPFLNIPHLIDVEAIVRDGKLHTEDFVIEATGNSMYDKYKEVLIRRGGVNGLELLVEQKEFPEPELLRGSESIGVSSSKSNGESKVDLLQRFELAIT